jgi:hypothetical protein
MTAPVITTAFLIQQAAPIFTPGPITTFRPISQSSNQFKQWIMNQLIQFQMK